MKEDISVRLSEKSYGIEPDMKLRSSVERTDLEQVTSFESELTSANDAVSKKEQKFYKEQQKEEDTPLSLTMVGDMIMSMFSAKSTLSEVELQDIRLQEPGVNGTQKSVHANEQVPRSLQASAAEANQKIFSEITPEFKALFSEQGKKFELSSLKNSSDFLVPRISMDALFSDLVKRVQFMKDGDVSHVKLDLEPEDLGRLEVLLSMQDKKVVIHIMSNTGAKQILDTKLDALEQALNAQGFLLEYAEVEVSSGSAGDQGQERFFQVENGKKVSCPDYDMLKIVERPDIMGSLNSWLADVMVNYVA